MNAIDMRTASKRSAGISDEEWAIRVDLAAAYRLVDRYGWSELAGNHISARIPGPEHHFLINPHGMLYDQITASSLVKIDCGGNVVGESAYPVNPAGFVIHSAIHMAHPHLTCVLHCHAPGGVAVSCTREGLLPMSQHSLVLMGWLAYHDYEGVALDEDERSRIVRDLGDGRMMILRNHGLLTVGESIGEAFVWMHRLEKSCKWQISALSAGSELNPLSKAVQQRSIEQGLQMFRKGGAYACGREWPSLLEELRRAGSDHWQ
jgi:ribulose-5-phosphate 4-epimerase/fuculose-1-phosphate aldolase